MLIRIRKNGQITLPAAICKVLNLKEGDILEASVEEDVVVLTPMMLIDKNPPSDRATEQ